jgi:hypothetical protein
MFTVLVQNDRLAVDVPGQTVFELRSPDDQGRWYFALTDAIAVSFEENDSGDVVSMTLYQAGLEFELPREGIESTPEVDLSEFERYFGFYRSETLGVTVEVETRNNRIAVDWPGETVYELEFPNDDGVWFFRVTDQFSLSFDEDAEGVVGGLTYHRAETDYSFERVEVEALPTVEEILALRQTDARVEALESIGDYKMTASLWAAQSGVEGTMTVYASGLDRYRVDTDYGRFGKVSTVVDGDRAWTDSTFTEFDELVGRQLEQVQVGHPSIGEGDLSDFYDIDVLRRDELEGIPVIVIRMSYGSLPSTTAYLDASNGDIIRLHGTVLSTGDIRIPVTTAGEDFREIDGLRIPYMTTSSNEATGRTVLTIETFETGIDLPEDIFVLEPVPDN